MRRWIKVWVTESLVGTMRFDFEPAERGVWYDLLILAGNCRNEGWIAAGKGMPYPHNWIAGTLNIPEDLLETTLAKCKDSERIIENGDGIQILNWVKYQSEYDRQKPYRDAKKAGNKTYKKCSKCEYKGKTAESECPECGADLETDYTGGKYGHMVRQ